MTMLEGCKGQPDVLEKGMRLNSQSLQILSQLSAGYPAACQEIHFSGPNPCHLLDVSHLLKYRHTFHASLGIDRKSMSFSKFAIGDTLG